MFSPAAFRKLVRASAIYDLLVTAPFATPWTFAYLYTRLSVTNQQLGGAELAPFGVFHTLFACLMGSIVLVWSVLRIADPQIRFGRYDASGRLLFSIWMFWTIQHADAPLVWLFLLPEMAWCLAQAMPVACAPGQGSKMSNLA